MTWPISGEPAPDPGVMELARLFAALLEPRTAVYQMPERDLAVSVKEAARRLSVSESLLRGHIQRGELPVIRLGESRLVVGLEALRRFAADREGIYASGVFCAKGGEGIDDDEGVSGD